MIVQNDYYFNLKGQDEHDNYLIDKYLTNRSKYRQKGIDIRTNGGYVVGAGSKIGNGRYQVINNTTIINNATIITIRSNYCYYFNYYYCLEQYNYYYKEQL